MSERLNIDESIRSKFEDFSVDPPAHVWDAVQDQMALQKKRSRRLVLTWISAAAVVVLAFMAGWYFNNSKSEIAPAIAENEPVIELEKLQSEKATEPVLTLEADNETEQELLVAEAEKPLIKVVTPAIKTTHTKRETVKETLPPRGENISLLARLEAFIDKETETLTEQLREVTTNEGTYSLSEADRLLMAANSARMKKNREHEKGWIVGAHLAPAYSSHSVDHDQTYARNISYNASNGSENIGGGFSVQYKATKKIRVESGVYYAKNGQRSRNPRGLSRLFEDHLDYAPNPTQLSTDGGFSNNVNFDNGTMVMNSTAGIIRLKEGVPAGASITRSDAENKFMTENVLSSDGSFSQVFDFVEIPLMLRYNLFANKFGMDILGGVNAGFVVGNNAYLSNDFGRQYIGEVEDISTLNVSGTVGLGMNYSLGKHFSLAFEPRFNYYLNSISNNTDVDYKPYRFALFTGVYYEF